MPKMLRFVAVAGENGGPKVQDYDAMQAGIHRFIGRKLDPNQGVPFETIDEKGQKSLRRHAVHVPHTGVDAIHQVEFGSAHMGEYLRHLRDGDLLPADSFTAETAGVKFDPKFEGALMWGSKEAPDDPATLASVVAAAETARGVPPSKPNDASRGGKDGVS